MSQIGSYGNRRSSADIRRGNLLKFARERGASDARLFRDFIMERAGREAVYLHRDMWEEYRKGLATVLPTKMVYTVSDLRELPVGTVIRDVDGDVSELRTVIVDRNENSQLLAKYEPELAWCGSAVHEIPMTGMQPFLPVVVLWEPGAPNDPECKDGGN